MRNSQSLTRNSHQVQKSGIEPGRGEGVYLITSWILSEFTG